MTSPREKQECRKQNVQVDSLERHKNLGTLDWLRKVVNCRVELRRKAEAVSVVVSHVGISRLIFPNRGVINMSLALRCICSTKHLLY